jgi:hypothetical protein
MPAGPGVHTLRSHQWLSQKGRPHENRWLCSRRGRSELVGNREPGDANTGTGCSVDCNRNPSSPHAHTASHTTFHLAAQTLSCAETHACPVTACLSAAHSPLGFMNKHAYGRLETLPATRVCMCHTGHWQMVQRPACVMTHVTTDITHVTMDTQTAGCTLP